MPTYKEQFDKITSAYFRNELDPNSSCACFIGNLLNGNREWNYGRHFENHGKSYRESNVEWIAKANNVISLEAKGLYTIDEIIRMENNFLRVLNYEKLNTKMIYDEENLFKAMDSTLDMLRAIHESKGEVIEPIEFKQRELA